VLSGGTVFVPVSFVRENFTPAAARAVATPPVAVVPEAEARKKFTIKTIVLDTGHGGKDVGAVGPAYGTKEKNLALALSRKIKAILESNGIRVIMTRSDDNFISLERRADIANKSGAELFVSVHINASRSRAMRGFECYYLSNATDDTARALQAFEDSSLKLSDSADAMHSSQLDKTLWDMSLTENRTESGELAGYICSSVQDSLAIKNRGVRTARFYVLKNTNIPSVLVEAGYLSNRLEELQLKDPKVLDRLAESIARGILRYKKRYESTEGFTNV
jgi:N-acetylmuramoyl-L-alanine amidase